MVFAMKMERIIFLIILCEQKMKNMQLKKMV